MSVPLPIHQNYCRKRTTTGETFPPIGNIRAHDLFLTSDERFEIFQVKAAERPHLLHYIPKEDKDVKIDNEKNSKEEQVLDTRTVSSTSSHCSSSSCSSSNYEEEEPPLIDGCDIAGWRKERLVEYSSDILSILNIGASSTMFRRESQWSVLFHLMDRFGKEDSPWVEMKKRLWDRNNIRRNANVVDYDECKQMVVIHDCSSRLATKFAMEYEQGNIPAVILGATRGWKSMPNYDNSNHSFTTTANDFTGGGEGGWTFSNLLSRFRNVNVRFSDTHGEMMSFETYAKYITNLEGLLDDSPLGIYDSEFGDEDSPTHELLEEYEVPTCFSPDLFELANANGGDSDRPPFRWILIGPERSGTGMHIDPLWTNAWVTVLQGKKRWMLFPPETPLSEIGIIPGEPQINSATWFKIYYHKVTCDRWPEECRPVEVLQIPGETVFVPNGWPHLVLNLELTVAVTHNYASEFGPFERMWKQVQQDEPVFAEKWLAGMKESRPDLVQIIQQIPTMF
jgi:JmjC domain.